MTPEEAGRLTLAELEALAERAKAAAQTLREAMALMAGVQAPARAVDAPVDRPRFAVGPVNLPTPARLEYQAGNPPATEEEAVGLNPEAPPHLAEARARRADFLRAARQDGRRAEALQQFKHDEGDG